MAKAGGGIRRTGAPANTGMGIVIEDDGTIRQETIGEFGRRAATTLGVGAAAGAAFGATGGPAGAGGGAVLGASLAGSYLAGQFVGDLLGNVIGEGGVGMWRGASQSLAGQGIRAGSARIARNVRRDVARLRNARNRVGRAFGRGGSTTRGTGA